MTSRARIITVTVALVALVTVAAVTVGLTSLGGAGTVHSDETGGDTDGTPHDAGAGNTDPGSTGGVESRAGVTPIGGAKASPSLLDRSHLPERTPDGKDYRAIVIFRDDDVQGFYRLRTLRALDRVFVDESVPVTHAVIPRIDGETTNITADAKTCSYLVRAKRAHPKLFELALHGYNHSNGSAFHGASEFGGLSYGSQVEKIVRGKAIMNECTGLTPRTFVPPFNTYDANTTAALRARGIETVSGGAWFTNEYYGTRQPFVNRGVVHVPSTAAFVRNWTTDDFYSQRHLRRGFDEAYENRSVYVQLLHYQSFNTTAKRDRLRSLLRYMKRHEGVKFMTVGEFSRAIRNGTLARTADGWHYGNETGNGTTGSGIANGSEDSNSSNGTAEAATASDEADVGEIRQLEGGRR